MTLTHSIRKAKKWSISVALRWAWKIVKNKVVAKIAGVTFGQRQEAIKRLWKYPPKRIVFTICREKDNLYDSNAIAIYVTVIGKGTFHMGYFVKEIAELLAPLLDKNLHPTIKSWEIIGGNTRGIKLTMELITGISAMSNDNSTLIANQHSALIEIR